MDLNLFKTFDLVMKTKSISETAKILDITAPAVSYALNRLREQYKDPLFIRKGKGIIPTSFSVTLHAQIETSLLTLLDSANEFESFDPQTSTRVFRISSHSDIDYFIMRDFFEYKKDNLPHVMLRAVPVELDVTARLQDLRLRKVDLIISTLRPTEPSFSSQMIMNQRCCIIARKDHPRINGNITISQFFSEKQIQWSTDEFQKVLFSSIIEQHPEAPNFVYRSDSSLSSLMMVSSTDLFSVVPEILAKEYADALNLQVIPLPFAASKISIYAVWHQSQTDEEGNKWCREMISQLTEKYR
ncbi:LysR family transcriptional regulator [Vibrio sp. SS-MA-C1-2]|uniref:LysR family transcriptional regulator n=1 Tax=Vibrio sp. SS-MA-C1-2 TaxID=2908646 RepID=UPI001F2C42F0|nr:LysR family transcriptional regulator [Vibrio sp. SS-MA-C1-2]UJF18063.1 LysR family transcriptional regulator [Vibrio sp. SS-MA-C1-2]